MPKSAKTKTHDWRIWTNDQIYQRRKNIAADTLSRIEANKNKEIEINNDVKKYKSFAIFEQYGIQENLVPVDYHTIRNTQQDDQELKQYKNIKERDNFALKTFGKTQLCVRKSDEDGKWRIFVPKSLRVPLMDWYHEALMHLGQARMEECTLKYFRMHKRHCEIHKILLSMSKV